MFTTATGEMLNQHNIRREFRLITKAAGLGTGWVPRELRHTFVSIMSQGGAPVEEIARLAGHEQTSTTELVFRRPDRRRADRHGGTLMGQAGVSSRVRIGDRAGVFGKSGVLSHVPDNARYMGYPAWPRDQWLRAQARLRRSTRPPRAPGRGT